MRGVEKSHRNGIACDRPSCLGASVGCVLCCEKRVSEVIIRIRKRISIRKGGGRRREINRKTERMLREYVFSYSSRIFRERESKEKIAFLLK